MTEREMMRKKAAARKARKERECKARNRRVVVTVALMLVVCVASIGGTIAWLTDSTEAVTNTFSPSNIDLWMTETVNNTLESTDDEDNANGITNPGLKIVPGLDISKDPKVAAEADVPFYVFVKVSESDWPTATETEGGRKVEYSIAEGWTELVAGEGETYNHPAGAKVYYRMVNNANGGVVGTKDAVTGDITGVSVLANDKVTVSENLDKSELNNIGTGDNAPTLSFTAYAIQMQNGGTVNGTTTNFTPVEAWNQVNSGN